MRLVGLLATWPKNKNRKRTSSRVFFVIKEKRLPIFLVVHAATASRQ